jgi:hypothetical protein
MSETIAEFLAGLGVKIDEQAWSRFSTVVTGATLQAKLLGDAIETMARGVAHHLAGVAEDFEQLYWQAQREGKRLARSRQYGLSELAPSPRTLIGCWCCNRKASAPPSDVSSFFGAAACSVIWRA